MTWLDNLTVSQIATGAALIGILTATVLRVYPWVRRFVNTMDALDGLPVALAQMGELKTQVEQIHHEVTPNGGGSIKDAVARIEGRQKDTHTDVAKLSERLDRHIDGNTQG